MIRSHVRYTARRLVIPGLVALAALLSLGLGPIPTKAVQEDDAEGVMVDMRGDCGGPPGGCNFAYYTDGTILRCIDVPR